jgi:lysozyme family protein
MKSSQKQVYEWVFIDEGGYTDHKRDTGGPTNLGITREDLARWRKKAVSAEDVKKLSKSEAGDIYTFFYWAPLKCDDLPLGVDYTMFDCGLLHGVVALLLGCSLCWVLTLMVCWGQKHLRQLKKITLYM